MSVPAVFLDRDGVLNVYLPGDYVKTVAELALLPGAGASVAELNALGFPVFVISNQQGVAKGLMTQANLDAVDAALHAGVSEAGGTITKSYYCVHHGQDGCDCRKPAGGMIRAAAREFDLDLAASVFVGDTETDALAARDAGVGAFVLVLSGKFAGRPEVAADLAIFPRPPDFVCADLREAVDWITRL
ncbi:MAG: HAD family hydrolase [Armatimonadetes bacterium]|nr:HAD family hydrolase [Armatimonadota bacterium]